MQGNLQGKRVIITGGSRGIGAAISRRFAEEGAVVAILFLKDKVAAETMVTGLNSRGKRSLAIQVDVSDPVQLLRAIDHAVTTMGGLDILVNNAGLTITGPLEDYSEDAFDRIFATNVRAPFLAAQKASGIMEEGGRIITIGSIVAERVTGAGGTLYAASKSALIGLTKGLARDLGARGITANLIQPGPIETDRNPPGSSRGAPEQSPLAIKRRGSADEVAGLAAYLASREADYVTGSVYNIDGGWTA